MSSFFSIFDAHTCKKVDVTPSYTDSSGNFVASVEVDSSMNAHISDVSIQERSFIDPVIVTQGVRKMACDSSYNIVAGDWIKVTELDTTTVTNWDVVTKISASSLLKKYTGESRESFLLKPRM